MQRQAFVNCAHCGRLVLTKRPLMVGDKAVHFECYEKLREPNRDTLANSKLSNSEIRS